MRKPKDIKIGIHTLEEILEMNLHCADLHCADLHCADLRGVDLHGADLRGADLCSANMRGADLHGAKMMGVDIRNANMIDTNMIDADMRGANMIDADMRGAKMMGADMRGANLHNVDMRDTDKLRKGIKLSEPIIGWKKCENNVLVKLEIPRGAIVFSINNSKCRTDKAKVLEIIGGDRAYSKYKFFSYYVGDVIEIFDFNCEYNVECAEGIHFFKTREEAEDY